MDFKNILALAADGHEFNRQEAEAAFDMIMSGEATPSQIGAFLMSLRMRGETVMEIAAAAAVMRAKALKVAAPPEAIDIVGTGGDRSGGRGRLFPPSFGPAQQTVCQVVTSVGRGPRGSAARRFCAAS